MNFLIYGNVPACITLTVLQFSKIENILKDVLFEDELNFADLIFKDFHPFEIEDAKSVLKSLEIFLGGNKDYLRFKNNPEFDYLDAIINNTQDHDVVLPFDELGKINLTFQSNINSINLILRMAELYALEEQQREMAEIDDWLPPDSFQFGTEDEQAVWASYYRKNKN